MNSRSPHPSHVRKSMARYFRRHYMMPAEHGAWIWLFGPLILGAAAGHHWDGSLLILASAALFAFMARQPATLIVKVYSGRRPRRDLAPSALWLGLESLAALGLGAILVAAGFRQVTWLIAPGVLVFGWHLWLVHRRAERRQTGVQVVASGVLALAAPAAYWVAGGGSLSLPWILWFVTWLQSAASIVFIHHRLEQANWSGGPSLRQRLVAGRLAWMVAGFNLGVGLALASMGRIPWLMAAGFAVCLADTLEGVVNPSLGVRPARLGARQSIVSLLFVGLGTLGFLV